MPRILIIDYDLEMVEQLRAVLEAEGFEVLSAVTAQAGIVRAEAQRPNVILLEVDLPDIDGYHVCRSLRAGRATARIPIIIYSARNEVADKVAGFEAGASDYVVKPAAPAELLVRIRAAARLEEPLRGHIVALWGTKGGVGTSTLATNLAVALRRRTGKKVTLVDAAVLGGTIGVFLNIVSSHTIADLLSRLDNLDSELLNSVLAAHASGVRVLLSPPWSTNGSIEPTQLERVLARLRQSSDYVVIDTSPSLDQTTVTVLQQADQVAMVLTPEMTSLRNARIFLKMVATWGWAAKKPFVVLNRYPVKGGIQPKDIQAALESAIDVQVPNDEAMVTYSINRGVPLVSSHPRSPIAKGFSRLAEVVIAASNRGQRAETKVNAPVRRS